MNRKVRAAGLFCALLLAMSATGCRQDMHNQPKFIPLRSSDFFPDQRSARYPVTGTIPQLCPNFGRNDAGKPGEESALCVDARVDAQQLDPNSYFLTGRQNGGLGNDLPFQPADLRAFLMQGRERYNIYCTPCHSLTGDGYGMIVQRGYKRPPSFHQDRLRNAPLGHFYDVMSNGFGAMPDYGAQIKPEDRWAIAAYIRALQRSQHPQDSDLTADDRNKLNTPSKPPQYPSSSKPYEQPAQPTAGGVKP
jgi:mono/diheme cytochrome c family protein